MTIKAATSKTEIKQTSVFDNCFCFFEVAAAILHTVVQTTSRVMGETTYSPIAESKSSIIYTRNVIISLYLMVSNAISVIKAEICPYFHVCRCLRSAAADD